MWLIMAVIEPRKEEEINNLRKTLMLPPTEDRNPAENRLKKPCNTKVKDLNTKVKDPS